MILRCYPTVSAIYFGDIPNLVSCAFSTIPIFPLLNSQNFLFTCYNKLLDHLIYRINCGKRPLKRTPDKVPLLTTPTTRMPVYNTVCLIMFIIISVINVLINIYMYMQAI